MAKEKTKREKATREWKRYFMENYKREPTREEGLSFRNGFGAGWKAHMKIASKYMYEELSEIINNLEDDLVLDLKEGDSGYRSYKESYNAVKRFTLKLLNKKIKIAEHNYNLGIKQKGGLNSSQP